MRQLANVLDQGLRHDPLYWCKWRLKAVRLEIPENGNIIVGQSHFVKTVEDLYEAMVNTVPGIKFGIAFNEASGACLTRVDGNDDALKANATKNAQVRRRARVRDRDARRVSDQRAGADSGDSRGVLRSSAPPRIRWR